MLRIFKNFRKQEVVLALFSVVFVVAQVWLELKLPDYMREITSLITTQDSAMHDILIAGGKMLLCAFGSLLVTVLVAVHHGLLRISVQSYVESYLTRYSLFQWKRSDGFQQRV